MIWQDMVMAIANILFMYSLAFQVWKGFKDKLGYLALQTTVLTTIGLYATAIALFTLQLYLSALVVLINGTLWFTLFVQRLVFKKAEER